MNNNIVCCGNIAFDLIAEKHKNNISFRAYPGGSVLNTAISLTRLGFNVSLLAKTGTDFLSDMLIRCINTENIDTRYIFRESTIKTSLAFAHLDRKHDSSYIFYKDSGSKNRFRAGELPDYMFDNVSVFHTGSGYTYSDDTFPDALALLKKARENRVITSYDPNWRENRIKDKKTAVKRIKTLMAYADILKLSDADAMGITGQPTLDKALKKIPDNTIVTCGKKGTFLWKDNKKHACPSFSVKLADTIGAGDGFMAGLVYMLLGKGRKKFFSDIQDSLKFASACAALVCMGNGSTGELRNVSRVNTFLAKGR